MKSLAIVRDEIDMLYGPPLQVLSDCLRGFLVASPGKKLIAVDFEQIEARVLAWLAGEERVLQVFRTHGKLYEQAAADVYGVPLESITKDDPRRQVGKVVILAFGYQGGKGSFAVMGKNYGVKLKEAEAERLKVAWREKNQQIVKYWAALNEAAKNAVFAPGTKFLAGAPGRQVIFKKDGSFLWCRLPSGRVICYPYPRVEMVDAPWTKETGEKVQSVTYMSEDSQTKQWVRHKAYGGLFSENITQAVARDILANALKNWEKRGYSIVCHVHDEGIAEVDQDFGSVEEMSAIGCELPTWAKDLPIRAGGFSGQRYRK